MSTKSNLWSVAWLVSWAKSWMCQDGTTCKQSIDRYIPDWWFGDCFEVIPLVFFCFFFFLLFVFLSFQIKYMLILKILVLLSYCLNWYISMKTQSLHNTLFCSKKKKKVEMAGFSYLTVFFSVIWVHEALCN